MHTHTHMMVHITHTCITNCLIHQLSYPFYLWHILPTVSPISLTSSPISPLTYITNCLTSFINCLTHFISDTFHQLPDPFHQLSPISPTASPILLTVLHISPIVTPISSTVSPFHQLYILPKITGPCCEVVILLSPNVHAPHQMTYTYLAK